MSDMAELVGKTLKDISVITSHNNLECPAEIQFTLDDGRRFRMFHRYQCCESVTIDDICGDLDDLVGSPLLMAEESSNAATPRGIVGHESRTATWTFYRFATIKGYVTIRWFGQSNGYYSERVDFEEIEQ